MVPAMPLAWLDAFASAVRNRDYTAARALFCPDVRAFGTAIPVANGIEQLETAQWRPIWDTTYGFTFQAPQIIEAGSLCVIIAQWSSRRTSDDSPRYGRATILLMRVDNRWFALHTHLSLEPT